MCGRVCCPVNKAIGSVNLPFFLQIRMGGPGVAVWECALAVGTNNVCQRGHAGAMRVSVRSRCSPGRLV